MGGYRNIINDVPGTGRSRLRMAFDYGTYNTLNREMAGITTCARQKFCLRRESTECTDRGNGFFLIRMSAE
jgi:hypothetical protein